jgi:tRNA A-37 threonylcarbamoyl transferase component Bud32
VASEDTEPHPLPRPPAGASRIDTLPADFLQALGERPRFIGDVLANRFKLVQSLGDGGMGQVFVAENVAISRKVAVKLLRTDLLKDADFRERFQREAEAIAAIDHPNVAHFIDLVVGDPTFLVMEYVPGPTLAERLKEETQLTPSLASSFARRLCSALEAAHRAGIIHRDIKPSNIVLTPSLDSGEEPKLIDFGLAKLAARSRELTRTGQLLGTPAYMSPEQISQKPVDARADVYALGCLLFHMLSGRPPFLGEDVQVLYRQVHEPAEPVSRHSKLASPELTKVVARALEKRPEDRFPSMRAFAQALAAADGIALPGGIEAPPAKRRLSLPLAIGLGLGAAAGGAATMQLWTRLREQAAGVGKPAIVIVTRPNGAQVSVDGQLLPEPTPTMARGLTVGRHQVRVQKASGPPLDRWVTLDAGERAVINVDLPPSARRVELRTLPEGAAVYLDGRLQPAETPATIEVSEDDIHELLLEKQGYEPLRRGLTPDDKEPLLTLPLDPERQARGTLTIDSNRAAQVWIDGIDTGYTTPTLGLRVTAGEHLVEVRDGNAHAQTRVKIAQGQLLRILLTPTEKGAP